MLLSLKSPCRHRGKVVRPCFASKELLSAGTPQQQRLARPARAAHVQRLSAVYSSCATLRRSHVHHLMLPLGGHPVSSRLPAAGESAEGASAAADERSKKHNAAVAFWSLAVVISGILNRVLYKMALKPLSNYTIFLAQFQTLAYTAIYFVVLFFKVRRVTVSKRQIQGMDKRLFLAIGAFEASALVMGLRGASLIPGVVLPLLQQSYLLWQVLVNKLLLGKNLKRVELLGAALVGLGVCYSAWPSGTGASAFSQANPIGVAFFTASLFLLVFDTLAKERVFAESEKQQQKPLDVFAVNSFGSASQAVFVLLLLPVLASIKGVAPSQLPDYLLQGWKALRGITPSCGTDVSAAPLLAILYIAMNLTYNVSVLTLLRTAGNVVMSLASSVLIPFTIWAFTWPWPYLDPAPALSLNFYLGAGIMLAGLAIFNAPLWQPYLAKKTGDSDSASAAQA